jgi:GTP1/Obg family GTP-binding protein
MKKVSDAAKAAAVMHFVSDSGDTGLTPEMAVELFNELGQTFGPVDEVLCKYDVTRWVMFEDWDDAMWWEQLELLALSVDAMFDYFEFPPQEF